MINPRYERIAAITLTAADQRKLDAGIAKWGHNWKHSSFGWLKELLKTELRAKQKGRCCYCRRPLRFDKGPVEIEHIVNKAKGGAYAHYTFTLTNLALCCKDCNNTKGTKVVLRTPLTAGSPYPTLSAAFVWVHPYMHDYSMHILIHDAWVYEAAGGSPEGKAVITKCGLAELQVKERNNRRQAIETALTLTDALHVAVGHVPEVGLDNICAELAPLLIKMMKSSATTTEAEQAIREVHATINRVVAEAI